MIAPIRLRRALAVSVAMVVAGGYGAGTTSQAPPRPETFGQDAAGHVHGLGVNPADGALFIATHSGLFRAAAGETRARPVGDARQDTMGFTVVGPDRFVGSGHPDARTDQPPLLGLIRSDDAGASWTPVSLSGEADFHVLRTSGRRLYGYDATSGALMVSSDDGTTWDTRRPPAPLYDLAIDPADADHVVAAGERGLAVSRDAGRSWRPIDRRRAGLLAWTGTELLLVDGRGGVHASSDAGRTWDRRGAIGGRPAALATAGDTLLVALHTNTVLASGDGGRTWRVRVSS